MKEKENLVKLEFQTLEKTKGATKNGHSRDTGKIGYTRHRMKTKEKKHNTTQKTKKMSKMDPTTNESGVKKNSE